MSDAAWMIAGLYGMVAAGVTVGLATSPPIKNRVPKRWIRWCACSWFGVLWPYEMTRIRVERLVADAEND